MHKILYKNIKERKKCDMAIKSTITKKLLVGKKLVEKK